jgi:hypothetical protein
LAHRHLEDRGWQDEGPGAEVWSRGFRSQGSEYAIWDDRGLGRTEVGETEFGRLGLRKLGRAGVGGTEVCKTVFGGPGLEEGVLEARVRNMHSVKTGGWEERRLESQGCRDGGSEAAVRTGLAGQELAGQELAGRVWQDVVQRMGFGGRGSEDRVPKTRFRRQGSEDRGFEDKGLEDGGREDRVERPGCRGGGWEYTRS